MVGDASTGSAYRRLINILRSIFQAPSQDQVRAFAGMLQAASLVHQLATRDSHDETALLSSALSVLRIDTDSVEEIYGDRNDLLLGYQVVAQMFGRRSGQIPRQLFQYSVAMHQLAVRIPVMSHVSEIIRSGLEDLNREFLGRGDFPEEDEAQVEHLYESLAGLYARSVSTLTPRIMVQGSQQRLASPATVNRVRTALFAGIRSAFLWHQLGGRRWHLLFQRRKYQYMASRHSRI